MIRGTVIRILNGIIRRFDADGRSDGEFQGREMLQHYGFSSSPRPGAELVIIREGNHFVAIADGDRRCQITLEAGEVAIHDDQGQKVHLTRDGIVALSPKKITAQAPQLELQGNVVITGELLVSGNITGSALVSDARGPMEAIRQTYNLHRHGNSPPPTEPM